jgi:hypothetical protein
MNDILARLAAQATPGIALPAWGTAVALALVSAGLMLADAERRGRPGWGVPLTLTPLAAAAFAATRDWVLAPALVTGLVVAMLVRREEDPLHSECALKLLWVLGAALALSWAGRALLVLATGTTHIHEQWAVLAIEVEPPHLWHTGLPLSLLLGLVLLGGAPFHFWASDLFHGARPWIAPTAVAALQVSGAVWLAARTEGITAFRGAAAVANQLLGVAALAGFTVGAATLLFQRRPERRVGTLASLNGTLALVSFIGGFGPSARASSAPLAMAADRAEFLGAWGAHLVLALTGAGIVSRFLPVADRLAPPPVLLRRHPWTGIAGLYATLSLAGAPGTPGARIWRDAAASIVAGGPGWLALAIGLAWLTAFAVAVRQARDAFGAPAALPPPERDVAWQARLAIWISVAGLLALFAVRR